VPSIQRSGRQGSGNLEVDQVSTPVHRAQCNVTAILVMYGLPRLLTGCIIAHELMHAWLRMRGVTGLNLVVEEGLCQLLALLWLDSQDAWARWVEALLCCWAGACGCRAAVLPCDCHITR
jgi:hypothetical protein